MTEPAEDAKLKQAYRDLGAEEPPGALDAAILAAAHRAVEARPAPLVPPTGRLKWYFPVAAAAVIVLAVAVSSQVERERPDDSSPLYRKPDAPQSAPGPAAPVPPPRQLEQRKENAPAKRKVQSAPPPANAMARRDSTLGEVASQAAPQASPEAPKVENQGVAREAAPAAAAPRAKTAQAMRAPIDSAPLAAMGLDEAPGPWLERIARLRREGRHEEADKALEEFRKRYPDYRIPQEVLDRVERR